MSPRVVRTLEELTGLIGQEVGASDWLTMSQNRINAFAETTGDDQWIHVDPERAATGPYGTTVAHGFLTLSLIPVLAREILTLELGSARVNYGTDTVRFPGPVPTGSRVRVRATIAGIEQTRAGVRVATTYTVDVEGRDRPGCVATLIVLIVHEEP